MFRTVMVWVAVLFVALLSTNTTQSQTPEVVVNEFFQASAPESEWTELLTIQDNISLVGYVLRDNSDNDGWQGGVRFADHALWRNLRAGTIIIIRHRGIDPVDVNHKDGFIEVWAENTTYFSQYMAPDKLPADWSTRALNLNQTRDILQIVNPSEQHVHAIGFGSNPDLSSLPPSTTLSHAGGVSNAQAVAVYPGSALADYGGGPSPPKTVANSTSNITRGLANKNTIGQDLNADFLLSVRQPAWNTPRFINAQVNQSQILLQWNSMVDPNKSDNVQGYLLLGTNESDSDTLLLPQDAKIYVPGQRIGNWLVLGNINDTTFVHPYTIPCGEAYKYRAFAFRFDPDNLEQPAIENTPRYGRGRNYLTSMFGQVRVVKPFPQKPPTSVSVANGQVNGRAVLLCIGNSAVLSTTAVGSLQWIKDGVAINGATDNTLTVSQSGQYRVRLTSSTNCFSESDEWSVTIEPKPIAKIIQGTEVRICENEQVVLQGLGGILYQWMKDGTPLTGQTAQTLATTSVGSYRVIASNNAGCKDTSAVARVVLRSVSAQLNKQILDFGILDGCKSSADLDIEIVNNGLDSIDVPLPQQMPAGFSVVSGLPAVKIAPGKRHGVLFRFTPSGSGAASGTVELRILPCVLTLQLTVRGNKESPQIFTDQQFIDFGHSLVCDAATQDSTINIINKGSVDMDVFSPSSAAPYTVVAVPPFSFPFKIQPNSSVPVKIVYAPSAPGTYLGEIKLPYRSGSCQDTLRVNLQAERTKPTAAILPAEINFQPLLGCDSKTQESIVIRNTTRRTLKFLPDAGIKDILFEGLPAVVPQDSSITVVVHYQPDKEGTLDVVWGLIAEFCSDTVAKVRLRGSKQGASVSLSHPASGIAFPDIVACEPVSYGEDSVLISLNNFNESVVLSQAQVQSPFLLDVKPGDTIKSGEFIRIRFVPMTDGTYSDSVRLVFQPCNIARSVAVRGRRLPLQHTYSRTLDFGIVDSSLSRTDVVVFKNQGKYPIAFDGMKNLTYPPFRLISSVPQLPAILAPDSSIALTIEYAPIAAGKDSLNALYSITAPCDTTFRLSLKGIGRNRDSGVKPGSPAFIVIGNAMAKPGERTSIPITLTSPDTAKFEALKVFSIELDLRFNPTVLLPLSVRPGQAQAGYGASLTESAAPGNITLKLEHSSGQNAPNFIKDGTLWLIEFTALLGDSISTDIRVRNDNFIGEKVESIRTEYDEGLFTLVDVCNLEGRLVRIGGNISLTVLTLDSRRIEFAFETISNESTHLFIANMQGETVAELYKGIPDVGIHGAAADISALSNGVYFVVLRSADIVRTLPLYLVQ